MRTTVAGRFLVVNNESAVFVFFRAGRKKKGKIVYLREFSEEAPAATPAAAIQETTPSANTPKAVTLKPGDLLYAIMDVGVNSDVPLQSPPAHTATRG